MPVLRSSLLAARVPTVALPPLKVASSAIINAVLARAPGSTSQPNIPASLPPPVMNVDAGKPVAPPPEPTMPSFSVPLPSVSVPTSTLQVNVAPPPADVQPPVLQPLRTRNQPGARQPIQTTFAPPSVYMPPAPSQLSTPSTPSPVTPTNPGVVFNTSTDTSTADTSTGSDMIPSVYPVRQAEPQSSINMPVIGITVGVLAALYYVFID